VARRPAIKGNCSVCGKAIKLNRKRAESGQVNHFCGNDCRVQWLRAQRPVTREWLYDQYVVKGLSCPEIAKIVCRDVKTVLKWMRQYEIQTRGRGFASTKKFVSGDPRFLLRKPLSAETRAKMSVDAKAIGKVPWNKEKGHPFKGKRGAETTNWKGGITAERQTAYRSDEWKAAVKIVWKRDKATCQRCGCRKSVMREIPFDIHHIVSFGCKILRFDVSNLILLCEPCHYWIHSRENTERLLIAECTHRCFEASAQP